MARLEVCVDSLAGMQAAVAGGADRVELCSALAEHGLTPSAGLMRAGARAGVPVFAMIRPRPGDFVFDEGDLAVAEDEIAAARAAGLPGVVIGASLPDGRLDLPALRRLMAAAQGLDVTLHRAFDLTPDLGEAVEGVAALGIRRVLSSGGAATAPEGLARLKETIRLADGRFSVMPGSGVTPANVAGLIEALGVSEVHSFCEAGIGQSVAAVRLGFARSLRYETSSEVVRAMKDAMASGG